MKAAKGSSTRKRERHTIPDDVLEDLKKKKLWDAYSGRPPYQRNDYIGWITGAKRPETRQKRLDQMLDELKRGDAYMNMKWRAEDKEK